MKVINKMKEWITWMFSANVRVAINNGASYEEVVQIVHEEVYGGT